MLRKEFEDQLKRHNQRRPLIVGLVRTCKYHSLDGYVEEIVGAFNLETKVLAAMSRLVEATEFKISLN